MTGSPSRRVSFPLSWRLVVLSIPRWPLVVHGISYNSFSIILISCILRKRPLADVWALDTAAKPYVWRKLEPKVKVLLHTRLQTQAAGRCTIFSPAWQQNKSNGVFWTKYERCICTNPKIAAGQRSNF